MKVLGINGSARKNGNTAILINTVFEELNKTGIETMKNLGTNMAYLLNAMKGENK
jgi:multimeric flavodoxin WrbA